MHVQLRVANTKVHTDQDVRATEVSKRADISTGSRGKGTSSVSSAMRCCRYSCQSMPKYSGTVAEIEVLLKFKVVGTSSGMKISPECREQSCLKGNSLYP